MTDDGACYTSKAFTEACKQLGIKHLQTKPYTPQTNGKAERFIQTALREWAYARPYQTSDQHAKDLPLWLHLYNWHRPHGGIKDKTPISRLGLNRDNLLRFHIYGAAPFGKWRIQTFIAGLTCDALNAPWVIEGAINGPAFNTYIET